MNELRIIHLYDLEKMLANKEFTGFPEKTDYLVKFNITNEIATYNRILKTLKSKDVICKTSIGNKYLLLEPGIKGTGSVLDKTILEVVEFYLK